MYKLYNLKESAGHTTNSILCGSVFSLLCNTVSYTTLAHIYDMITSN